MSHILTSSLNHLFIIFRILCQLNIKHIKLLEWCEAIKGEGNLAELIKLIAVKWQKELTL